MKTIKTDGKRDRERPARAQSVSDEAAQRLAGLLPEEVLQDALKGLEPEEITGPGGLLTQLAGRVIETALDAELGEYLGHPPSGRPTGANVRNGAGAKTVKTDLGPVEIRTPRGRAGSFDPKLVAKRQTRLAGLDDKILGLYAGGMTVRDISAHLAELIETGAQPSRRRVAPSRRWRRSYALEVAPERDERTQVSCGDCGHVRFDGEWTQEAADAHTRARECPKCGSSRATISLAAMTATVRMTDSYRAEVHDAEHDSRRASLAQKQVGGTFARGDGRGYVERGMVISKRPPRFKWHRVVDEGTEKVEKNLLERHDDQTGKPTGETWDFTDPSIEPPDWFPHDPRSGA